MTNVLILVDMLDSLSGGSERQIMELCKNINRRKYKLTVACLSEHDGLLKEITDYGIKTTSFKVKRIYSLSGILKGLEFIRFVKRAQIDVLITYHFGSDVWGAIFGKLAGIKVIISSRRDSGFWRLKYHDLTYRITNRWVDKIFAVSESVKGEILKREYVSTDKVDVIYNGVNLDYFSQEMEVGAEKNKLGIKQGGLIVGVISWIRYEKGIDYFLSAAAKINEKLPNVQFAIVGDGPEKDKMVNLAKQLKIEKNVHFLGWRLDIPKILKTFDILVSPSLTEGFSNTVIEAMACSRPIVATAVGGNREVISNGKTGILVEPKDAQAISEAVLFLLANSDKRKKMGLAAYHSVKERFDILKTIDKLQKLLDYCLYEKDRMYITAFPRMSLSHIIRGLKKKASGKIDDPRIAYTYCGSCAIYNGIKALKLNSADNILMPSYHCGVEIDMVIKAGINVRFYSINEDMSIDIDDIKRKIDRNTKGIYVIHYFGFIQPMREVRQLCNERNIFLIEDSAHLLLEPKDIYQKSLGDLQIFSFIKTLPVADGGALVFNRRNLHIQNELKKVNKTLVLSRVVLSLAETVKSRNRRFSQVFEVFLISPLRYAFRLLKKLSQPEITAMLHKNDNEFYARISDYSISRLSLGIINSTNFKEDIKKRRENFSFLLQGLKGLNNMAVLYDKLPEDTTPLFFPILTQNRDILSDRLAKRGVQTFIFGKNLHRLVPGDNFTFSHKLSSHNLCLPIHQNLDRRHMEYVLDVLKAELEKISHKEKRILHLISSNGLFGAEKVVLSLAREMNQNGLKVWVGAVKNLHNPHLEIIDAAKKDNIPTFTVESRGIFDLKSVSLLDEFINEQGINLIHSHNYKANFLGLLAAKRAKIPIIATLHGYLSDGWKLRIYEKLDRYLLRFFNRVVFVDESLKRFVGNNSNGFSIINNGISVKEIAGNNKKDDSSSLVIGTVARLSREKGHQFLLGGFARIRENYPQAKLLIVGDGKLREKLEALSTSLGIQDSVEFAGLQADPDKYYEQMDIYVSSSLTEHFPIAILEAMTWAKAIIATNVGGTAHLIKDRQTGLLINPASCDEIYQALTTFIKNRQLKEALGKNAQHFVKDNYSLEKTVVSYKGIYAQVLNG